MKKTIAIASATLLAVVSLAACSTEKTEELPVEEEIVQEDSDGDVEIEEEEGDLEVEEDK